MASCCSINVVHVLSISVVELLPHISCVGLLNKGIFLEKLRIRMLATSANWIRPEIVQT